jgi:hypothetical protein
VGFGARAVIGFLACAAAASVLLGTARSSPVAGSGAGTPSIADARQTHGAECRKPGVSSSYVRRVSHALRARQDVWGKALLAAPGGPTYERVSRYLNPLLLARAPKGRALTESGVHYAHFTMPNGAWGATSVALHVADGSQILSRRARGRGLRTRVGVGGRERYGSCLRRLAAPALAEGYLPILRTRYVDGAGVRYRQESFAAQVPETRSLVSFVRITADAARSAARVVRIRFTPSATRLEAAGGRLRRDGRTHLFFSDGGQYNGSSVKYGVARGGSRTVYVAWLHTPMSSLPIVLDETRWEEALESVRDYWQRRLARGGSIIVPEKRVVDAERNLLIQNMGLTWRYSIGNRYEQFSTPEGVDVGRVLAAYGHPQTTRAILHTSIKRRAARHAKTPIRNPNWKMGARLVGFADQARLSGDLSHVVRATPVLQRYLLDFAGQLRRSRNGLLQRERYSSDVPDRVYGLHSQAVVWQGLRAMAPIWERTGHRDLAILCRRLAAKLKTGIRRALRASQRRLADGTLFVPVRLYEHEKPYRSVTESRAGSYWNLVMPYALASGILEPGSSSARGVLQYMLRHGSRLLGLVRTGAFTLYGEDSRFSGSGSNPVYGLNVARFLADNDQAGQLVLSLYGHLAAAMAPGTFISGEGVSIAPLRGEHHRSMYLPPNGASNAAFLETLRLMLVHEKRDRYGLPRGLQLAYSTPRSWLRPGKRIEVKRMATSFGRLAFTIESGADSVLVSLDVPERAPLQSLSIRLRLPGGKRIASVLVDGTPHERFDASSGTIALSPRPGHVDLQVRLARG